MEYGVEEIQALHNFYRSIGIKPNDRSQDGVLRKLWALMETVTGAGDLSSAERGWMSLYRQRH